MSASTEVVLVSNGPGELYTWAKPVLDELRRRDAAIRVVASLIPCQFAAGNETEIAGSFAVDAVTSPAQTVGAIAGGGATAYRGDWGAVISLGGNTSYAVRLGDRLGYPVYRYGFEPQWHPKLARLFLASDTAAERSRRRGAPAERIEVVGNLVADAVRSIAPIDAPGEPHVLVVPGSRDIFARPLIPFVIAIVDRLARDRPHARFVWPVSRLLEPKTIEDGIRGVDASVLGGVAGARDGDVVRTPSGATIEMVPEGERHAHMRAADLAITIPGTNTLELGIVGVPSIVMLPMNKPELIPLEGIGHWLGVIPGLGRYLKRYAVRLFVEGLDHPISLPNRFAGERIFEEITGSLTAEQVADAADRLLNRPELLQRQRERLAATMPGPGAAARLVDRVLGDLDVEPAVPGAAATVPTT